MKTKLLALLLAAVTAMSLAALAGCGGDERGDGGGDTSTAVASAGDLDLTDWDAVVAAAQGTNVTFTAWGEDATLNDFMNGYVADYLKDNYDINFTWVPVGATSEAVTIVSDEKQAGVGPGEGTIDLVWIDSENFATMKNSGLLYGEILSLVPNAQAYLDLDASYIDDDAGTAVEGYEIPWDPGIYVMIHDSATTSWTPKDADEFLDWCKEYKGFITYPSADDTYGRRMIWQFCEAVLGSEWWTEAGLTPDSTNEEIQAAMEPALEYMRELNPYLWNEGQTYPSSASEWKNMFANGEVGLCFDWTPYTVGADVAAGVFPDTSEVFTFDYGAMAGMGYMSIPYDAPNVAGALVAINALLTPELQYGMLEQTGYPNAIIYDKLPPEGQALADAIDTGVGSMTVEEVANLNLTLQPPSWIMEPINQIWWAEVAGKTNN